MILRKGIRGVCVHADRGGEGLGKEKKRLMGFLVQSQKRRVRQGVLRGYNSIKSGGGGGET